MLVAVRNLVSRSGTAAIYISHDLAVVAQLADRIMVLRAGRTIEDGGTRQMLTDGPPGIQSQRDVDAVVDPLLRTAAKHEPSACAFVIACFSDPGLHALREQSACPVLGIAESGVLTALTMGQRFGVISILPASIPRHLRYFGAMGVMDRLAANLSVGLTVAELADDRRTIARMTEVGLELRDRHGADVLVMGCAGMARFRAELSANTGLPVVEPTIAATGMALSRVLAGC